MVDPKALWQRFPSLFLQGYCGGLHAFYLQCFEKLTCLQYCRIGSVVAITPSYLEREVCLHSWQEVK